PRFLTDEVMLLINNDTQIVTKNNQVLTVNNLKKGMHITAYHDLVMTMSILGITLAKKNNCKINKFKILINLL
ncbi:hypothetical protein SAMN02745883_02350, partial [Caminicella sporogenes DSM 14501]